MAAPTAACESPPKPPDIPNKPPDIPIKTFASIVAGEKKKEYIEAKVPETFKGEPAIFFTEEEVKILAEPFKFALVGKFTRGRPNMIAIRNFFTKLNLRADYKVGLLDSKHILIHLKNEEDYHRIWLRSQWNIFQFPMAISKWHVNYTPENESPIVPIWVAMPYLPPHLFREDALLSIARTIGIPMRTDTSTATLARPSKARVCVEVDISKPLPKRGYIGQGSNGFWQQFQYEDVPMYCGECKKIGHESGKCIMTVEEKQETKQKTQDIITSKPQAAQNKATKETKQNNKQQFIYRQKDKAESSKQNSGDPLEQPEKEKDNSKGQEEIIDLENNNQKEDNTDNQNGEEASTQGIAVHNMFNILVEEENEATENEEVEEITMEEEPEKEENRTIKDGEIQYTILRRGESLVNFQKANSTGKTLPKVLAENLHLSDNDTPNNENISIEDLQKFSSEVNMPMPKTTEIKEVEGNKKKKKHQKNAEHQRNTRASARGTQTQNKNNSR